MEEFNPMMKLLIERASLQARVSLILSHHRQAVICQNSEIATAPPTSSRKIKSTHHSDTQLSLIALKLSKHKFNQIKRRDESDKGDLCEYLRSWEPETRDGHANERERVMHAMCVKNRF